MNNHIENFLEMLLAVKNVALSTVNSYKSDLKDWEKFIYPVKVEKITYSTLNTYLEHLFTDNFRVSTVRRKIATLRHFYKFLCKEGVVSHNPTLQLESVKKELKLPKFLSADNLSKLFIEAQKNQSPEGTRTYALLETLYSTGMRISELTTLKLASVKNLIEKPKVNYLLVKGKGEKERAVFFTLKAIEAISMYIKVCKVRESIWLFPGDKKRGRNAPCLKDLPMTRQRLAQLLKSLAKAAGLDPRIISPHVLRHSFATHLMDKGLDLKIIQELLGHSSITTTQIYTYIANNSLHSLVLKYHPLSSNSFF